MARSKVGLNGGLNIETKPKRQGKDQDSTPSMLQVQETMQRNVIVDKVKNE